MLARLQLKRRRLAVVDSFVGLADSLVKRSKNYLVPPLKVQDEPSEYSLPPLGVKNEPSEYLEPPKDAQRLFIFCEYPVGLPRDET